MRFSLSEWRLPLILGTLALLVLVGNILINLSWRENTRETSLEQISLNQRKEGVKPNLPIKEKKPSVSESKTSLSDESKELEEVFQSLSADSSFPEATSSQEAESHEIEAQGDGNQKVERSETSEIPEGYYLYEGKLYPLVRVHKIKLPDGRVVSLKLERGKKYRILTSWRNPNPRHFTPEEKRQIEKLMEKELRLIQEIENEPSEERRRRLVEELFKVWKERAKLPPGPCLGWDSVREIWLRLPGQSEPSEVITIDLRDY